MLPKDKPIVTTTVREIRNIEEKARQRKVFREYIIKERSNPFRQAANIGGGFIVSIRMKMSHISAFLSQISHSSMP